VFRIFDLGAVALWPVRSCGGGLVSGVAAF